MIFQADYIPPGTPYPDEPSVLLDPGNPENPSMLLALLHAQPTPPPRPRCDVPEQSDIWDCIAVEQDDEEEAS